MSNNLIWLISALVCLYPGYKFLKWSTDNFRFGAATDNFAYMNFLSGVSAFCIITWGVHFLISLRPF